MRLDVTRLKRVFLYLSFVSLLATVHCVRAESGTGDVQVDFKKIRSILSDNCFHCHGPDASTREADLRLDTQEGAYAERDGIAAIVPGDIDASELYYRLITDDKDELMPPPKTKKKLSKEQIALIGRWIKSGGKYEQHWSFVPLPESIHIPEGKSKNPIDRFIEEKLKKEGLSLSAHVSADKWLRRVCFDLTGLPPSMSELDAFLAAVKKEGEAAYEKEVDRLLKTDAYAERMTSEWLDVARYADSYGYQVDADRFVWPWRDWVIRAFKNNMPYDQFVTEQLAGDLLPNATRDQRLATTFNRLHSQKVEGGSVEEEFRMEYVADRVNTFGTAFLGLSMDCTKCHDHKYDPLTQRDFFSLSAFFANIDEAGLYSFFDKNAVPTPALSLPTDMQKQALEDAVKQEQALQAAFRKAEKDAEKHFDQWLNDNKAEALERKMTAHTVHLDFETFQKGKFANLAQHKLPASSSGKNIQVQGRVGSGVKLTGDHAINLPKGTGDFSRNQPFSLALWIKSPQQFERAVLIRRSKAWTDAASRGYEVLIEDGKLSAGLIHFWPGNAIRVVSKEKLHINQWQHIAVTYDGSSKASGLKLFLNGQSVAVEIVKDKLTRQITGSGDPFVGLGQRMRDRGFKGGVVDEFHVYARELAELEVANLAGGQTPSGRQVQLAYYLLNVDENLRILRQRLLAAREQRAKAQEAITQIMVMEEKKRDPRKAYILDRGSYENPKEEVHPATPAFLSGLSENKKNRLNRLDRLDLARWLTGKRHPLMLRVTVNRYWQMIFGRGLVATSEDFGSQGDNPTHPKLLDWLARDFQNNDWDIHHLLRQMVLSKTYRQLTHVSPELRQRDPENRLLARGSSTTLPAEMIRDNALAVSGLLSNEIGGKPVNPYDLALSFKPSKPSRGKDQYRRSLYTFWKRTGPSPMMMTLDAAKRDVCTVKRERTTSPLQSLVLLNAPQFIEAARKTAENLLHLYQEDRLISENAFRLMTSRKPEDKELAILVRLLQEQQQLFNDDPSSVAKFLGVGDKPGDKSIDPVRLAAVTSLVSTLMNFDECIQKR